MLSVSKNVAFWLLLATFTALAEARPQDTSISGNLARGRTLSASSTCGLTQPERLCAQPSSNSECAVCDHSHPDSTHPTSHLTDEDSVSMVEERTWWQSEGGMNNVTIQLDLENTFLFTHVLVLFKSTVPAAMYIDKSVDFGSTYQVLQYFSTDCQYFFGLSDTLSSHSSSNVNCTSAYQEGEVLYLVFPPPMQPDYSNADDVARAKLTNLRVHLLAFSREDLPDPQVRQKYSYAIYHLEVWGRCFCNGKAKGCLQTEAEMADGGVPSACQCIEGTDGTNCEKCLPLYNDQDPQDGLCTECECNGHASSCHYDPDESQGVCDDCADATAGSKCEQCQQGFYRDASVPITDQNTCLPCACSAAGTMPGTFCAEEDGGGMVAGQCTCKSNVNGLLCDQCKDGFFGLSEADPSGCQACSASCADCDKLTGRCPFDGTPSSCLLHQYYDGTSCQECECSELGSFGVCDLSGSCVCKPGVGGTQCDECLPGYYNLSADGCAPCDCDLAGSSRPSECNSSSGECLCRERVSGRRCDICPPGTIGPNAETFQACIDCFCNGFSTDCSSASGWYVTETPNAFESGQLLQPDDPDDFNEVHMYFPDVYLGDKRTAYGLPFSLTVGFPELQSPSSGIKRMSLIIYGRLGYSRVKVQKTFDSVSRETKTYHVPLIESEFEQVLYYRQPAKMEYFRQGLAKISSMKLVIEFSRDIPVEQMRVNISSAKMFYADQNYDSSAVVLTHEVSFVEECSCKQDREGRVCGQCSEGYHFDHPTGISGEFSQCVPCYCHGYSKKCDPVNGACLDCQKNRAGDDCEGCAEGFIMDPTSLECLSSCACSRNAYHCTESNGECFCKDGYFGDDCQFCDEGYYGDALQHNCADCGCSVNGTVEGTQCHLETGQCMCKPSVIGRSCDRCESNHWGFASGAGCKECGCSVTNSRSHACDLVTGQCDCMDGYSGRTCDICADSYTDKGDGSCIACDCNPFSSISAVCNKQTGICQCRKGVTGKKCDQCLPGTTGLLPVCELCDECSLAWEEPVQSLEASATTYIMIAGSINITNMTSSEMLQQLFVQLEEIETYLNSSAIDSLVNSTLDLYHELCEKISLLEDLLRRAMLVKVQLNGTLTDATILNNELTQIITKLKSLVMLSVNISAEAAELKTVDFAGIVNTIREAEERSNASMKLVMTEVSSNIAEANQSLQQFLSKENELLLIVDDISSLLLELNQAIDRYQLLVDEASRRLCGNPQGQKCDGDGVCGGVGCEFCGGEGCDGSVDQVQQARSISDQALFEVKELLESLTNTTFELRRAKNESELALYYSIEATAKANMSQLLASHLSLDTKKLLVIVVDALSKNLSLFSLEMLEMIENETLLLRISKTPEEVHDVLIEINNTIDKIKMVNLDVENLRKRAETARNTSLRANATAHKVLTNASLLRTDLEEIKNTSETAEANIAVTGNKITQAEAITTVTRMELGNLTETLSGLETTVIKLNATVHELQLRFDKNRNDLDDISTLIQDAVKNATDIMTSTSDLEMQEMQLQNDADAKLTNATSSLEVAKELRRMTEIAKERAIQQLLLAERILNRRECIVEEQMRIQDDIKRVANELEGLDRLINSRIALNTVCLYQQGE